jgi:hypothetical protein
VAFVLERGLMERTGQALSLTAKGAAHVSGVIALFFAPSIQAYLRARDPERAEDVQRNRRLAARVCRGPKFDDLVKGASRWDRDALRRRWGVTGEYLRCLREAGASRVRVVTAADLMELLHAADALVTGGVALGGGGPCPAPARAGPEHAVAAAPEDESLRRRTNAATSW